jgi:hypothetical protein
VHKFAAQSANDDKLGQPSEAQSDVSSSCKCVETGCHSVQPIKSCLGQTETHMTEG